MEPHPGPCRVTIKSLQATHSERLVREREIPYIHVLDTFTLVVETVVMC